MFKCLRFAVLLIVCTVLVPRSARAYSLLTHEQLIDLTWESSIVPLLLSRYPTLTPAQVEHARAYAYGGCVIQDIGYYPFGDSFFSNLTHYVRTGDFVVNLFRNAGNADELAFAVGALSHYIGDSIGHSQATNRAVPVEFPKLGQKYGDVVNYAEGEHQHVQTEFAFDINEIAHRRFAPVGYLRHVGLKVPNRQLTLAFYQTYGLREDFTSKRHRRINVRGYRFAVHDFIPSVAYATTLLHYKHEPADGNNTELQQLTNEIAAVAQKNDWDAYRRSPGLGIYSLAALLYILPKLGPLKLADVKGPTSETEIEYLHSVNLSTGGLSAVLHRFTPPSSSAAAPFATSNAPSDPPPSLRNMLPSSVDPSHPLLNRDLDTGGPVLPGGDRLTDNTYATLLHRLAKTPKQAVPPDIQHDILAYYADLSVAFSTQKDPTAWANLQRDLTVMRTMPISSDPLPYRPMAIATAKAQWLHQIAPPPNRPRADIIIQLWRTETVRVII